MAEGVQEAGATCPHCWQPITMLVDTSVPEQRYVEDCEVCCNPLDVHCVCAYGQVLRFEVEPAQ